MKTAGGKTGFYVNKRDDKDPSSKCNVLACASNFREGRGTGGGKQEGDFNNLGRQVAGASVADRQDLKGVGVPLSSLENLGKKEGKRKQNEKNCRLNRGVLESDQKSKGREEL